VMITGSHNPPQFNGFKICLGTNTIYGEQIQEVRRIIEEGEYTQGEGVLSFQEITKEYQDYILKGIRRAKGIKVVIDGGNGTAGRVASPLMKGLGCEVTELYCEMDGHFPHHHPDPTILENLKELRRTVKEKGADVGMAYDGDGDRLGVVDERGEVIWGDRLSLIFARDILDQRKGGIFTFAVQSSQIRFDEIERLGGRAIMGRTGHSLIKEKMRREGALFAGEMSGHFFFADRYFGYDDAIYASCRLLEIMAKKGRSLSQLLEGVPESYCTPEIRWECPDEIKFALIERLKREWREGHEVIELDGLRVRFPQGWGLVRASNTQPALVLRFEGMTPQALREIRETMEEKVRSLMREMRG